MEQELEILQGVISAVVYENYDNGYAVLRLNVGGGHRQMEYPFQLRPPV